MRKWERKVSTFALGTRHCMFVDEKGQLCGEGVSNGGAMGTEVQENKSWINIKFPAPKEKIVNMSCGYDYSMVVTNRGSLFIAGNNFLTKLNMANMNKFERIDLGQSTQVISCAAGYSVMGLILVKN
mmetsp:Transcript_22210/g.16619  ORF Transcript_22210/g.16619 Transcript_22210/m.16619 type:complete len:127 (+) Transcript_22210:2506-2886(+)